MCIRYCLQILGIETKMFYINSDGAKNAYVALFFSASVTTWLTLFANSLRTKC